MEFRTDGENYATDQTITVKNADIGKYSMLRVLKAADAKEGLTSTTINFGNVTMENLSGIGFGLFGMTSAPDAININELTVEAGGDSFSYAALLSSDKDGGSTVHIGTININNNTLDLAGTPAQTLFSDLKSSGLVSIPDITNFLDGYAQKIDAGMNDGYLITSIVNVINAHGDSYKSLVQKIEKALESALSEELEDYAIDSDTKALDYINDVYGYVNGITLGALSSNNGHVTINMNYDSSLSGGSPQIKIGEVADNTWVDINFNKASLDSAYGYDNSDFDGQYAVMLSGSGKGNYVINLHYTDGYQSETETEIHKILDSLAAKVGQSPTVATVNTDFGNNNGDPVTDASNSTDYSTTQSYFKDEDDSYYQKLLVSVGPAYGSFATTLYTYGLKKATDEDKKNDALQADTDAGSEKVHTGYVVDYKAEHLAELDISKPSTGGDGQTPSGGDDDNEEDGGTYYPHQTVVNDAKQALLDPSVYTAMLWRVQMNNLVNRLGDLHEAKVPNGGWVRFYGGSLDFDDRHIDSDYIGVQAGVDFKVGAGWTLGAALSYTDGDADYRNGGSSDASAYDFALYGTWMHENGLYVDLVGRVGRVSNDSDVNIRISDSVYRDSDSYNATAWGLSAEVGWKVPVTEMFFIEPQAQLSYAHISSESADFGKYSADYDSIDMLIGRLGVRTGFELPDDHGSIYLRANVLQDFDGDVDSTLHGTTESVSSSEDMDDAWFEVGLGATVKFTDNFYLYAECTYADGGDVDSVYGNLGARLMF